jgi:outer membrane protein OmpA-like peptidoglycan-associated protein
LFAVALAVCGCAGVTPPKPTSPAPAPTAVPAPTPPSADQRTAFAAALTIEKQWLDSWFRGTPVRVAQRDDGALLVEVPREFSFDPGRSSVKPALAAVLDKVAESLRRRPTARLALVAAPDDMAGSTPLALQRAAQVHKHLRDRGVPSARLAEPTATTAVAVQLRIAAPPP